MNQVGAPIPDLEKPAGEGVQPSEIPSYPGATSEEYVPEQEGGAQTVVELPAQYEQQSQYIPEIVPQKNKSVDFYNAPEQAAIPQSKTPELQTNISIETTRAGERVFANPELGQATFSGGVTAQQLVSKVAGYYTVQHGLINDPKSGLLQQSARTGDPASATTWQATILYKILQAFWDILGIGS